MGNQGMTNWKFTTFFAITVMLVAGLVHQYRSSHCNGHGDGRAVLTVDADGGTLQCMTILSLLPVLSRDITVHLYSFACDAG